MYRIYSLTLFISPQIIKIEPQSKVFPNKINWQFARNPSCDINMFVGIFSDWFR